MMGGDRLTFATVWLAVCSLQACLGMTARESPSFNLDGKTPQRAMTNSEGNRNQPDAIAVKERHDSELMKIPDVVGTGISQNSAGQPVIEIYVEGHNADLN